jgi:hypothetical protein
MRLRLTIAVCLLIGTGAAARAEENAPLAAEGPGHTPEEAGRLRDALARLESIPTLDAGLANGMPA